MIDLMYLAPNLFWQYWNHMEKYFLAPFYGQPGKVKYICCTIMSPPIVCFFTTPRDQLALDRFYKPPAAEALIIKRFVDAGYNPVIDSLAPSKECAAKAIALERPDSLEFVKYNGGSVFCLIYWNTIDCRTLAFAHGHFNKFIQGREGRVGHDYKTRYAESVFPPAPLENLGGTKIVEHEKLPDGREIIARVEGGERASEVDKLVEKTKEVLQRLEERKINETRYR